MKQLNVIVKEPTYIADMGTMGPLQLTDIQTKLGPDWNPRSLSSFSTFGGTGAVLCNGHKDLNNHQEVNGHHKEIGEKSPPLTNGDSDSEPHPLKMNGVMSKKSVYLVSPSDSKKQPSHARTNNDTGHYANSEVILKHQPLKISVPSEAMLRHQPTKVPPPIAPRHTHSKSLVGEELQTMHVPSHSHSRSLVDPNATGTNFKDGIGDVTLFLGNPDRRFGFSVIGGIDERFSPRIDEIAKGSPADKADLEVGDEILEVNGKSLEDATHTEVISHIHQCIRSRTICLRVKRRTGNKLAADLAASSNVQDAFVIAVEQKARERLERLSALKKIKPVDMTKLSTQLSDPLDPDQCPDSAKRSINGNRRREEEGDLSPKDVSQSSPIYVTSVPNLTSSSTSIEGSLPPRRTSLRSRSSTPAQNRTSSSSPPVESSSSSKRRGKATSHTPSIPLELDLEANKSGDELELKHNLHDEDEENDREEEEEECHNSECQSLEYQSRSEEDLHGDTCEESEDSLPATPEKTYGIAVDVPSSSTSASVYRNSLINKEVLLDPPATSIVTPSDRPLHHTASLESTSSRKSGGSGGSSSSGGVGGPPVSHKPPGGSSRGPHPTSRNIPLQQDTTMISMVEFDPAKREMAVDVPDTFIGKTKTPPRYPPPKPSQKGYGQQGPPLNSPLHHNSMNSNKKLSGSTGTVTPVNGTLSKVSPPQETQKEQQRVVVQSPNSQEEANKLKRYEEEIKQRREREEDFAELQRTSIRDSQKLRALASYPHGQPQPSVATSTGVTNEAFENDIHVSEEEGKPDSPSINELIESLQRIQSVLKSNGHRITEDVTLVASLLTNPEFQKVLAVHNKVQETWCLNRPPTPVAQNAEKLLTECLEVLQQHTPSSSTPEDDSVLDLIDLLNKFSFEGLMYAHDRIAEREPPPFNEEEEGEVFKSESVIKGDSPGEVALNDRVQHNYPEVNVKIVRIDKTNEALGATIRNEGDAVIIGRIVRGGAAEKSGLLHEGDEILEVNNIEVRGKSVNEVCDTLAGMQGTLTFIINPCSNTPAPPPVQQQTPILNRTMHVKAYFDYDPEDDLYIPCRELGMSFQKGDILRVMNQSDPNWWQAYRDGEEDQALAGLIPSKAFQQQREAERRTAIGDSSFKEKPKKGKLLCAKKHHKKKKKMLYPSYNEDFDNEEILTYEEVALYFPRVDRKRPVVLIGPPNIGRHELRQKLMEDRERFSAAVPHTSRPKKDGEVDGQDYHFISRTQFEADILARKFVEHGEYEKAYYGTSLNAIRAVVNSGKICVLNLHPLSLKMLKNSDLKPFVVLIAPPSLEKLRQKKQKMGEPFKEEELKETIQRAREMEDKYGHYFDHILINHDIERTYTNLLHEINILEREPQWVPATWLTNEPRS